MIGGVDVTPDQVFQVMKYLKATGQMMSQDALLQAFIAMPDISLSSSGSTGSNTCPPDEVRSPLRPRPPA